jgi:hypothetical protein
MGKSHGDALQVLQGLPLRRIGRAADMLWLHFGEWRDAPSRHRGSRQVGEWALHLQTAWNFARNGRILVGTRDFYFYAEGGDDFDFDKEGKSRFDDYAAELNQEFESEPPRVTRIACDSFGMLTLGLTADLTFSALPTAASASTDFEFWRLFQPATENPHYVVMTDESQDD